MKLTIDGVIFGYREDDLKILLIKRKYEPFKNQWALPGGYVKEDENLEEAVSREILEETGIDNLYLEQLYTFGVVDRDPRGRTVSVAHYGLVKPSNYELKASTDAEEVEWFSYNNIPSDLAFDHLEIIDMALERIKGKLRYVPIGFELLSEKFTLKQVEKLYETILNITFDSANFRKKFLKLDILDKLDEKESDVKRRPGTLYRFNKVKYEDKLLNGFYFEI